MTNISIKTATASDQERIIAAILLAFVADPMARWSYPDPQEYLRNFPDVIKTLGGNAFEHDSAYYVEGFSGAALWLPPDIQPSVDELVAGVGRTFSGRKRDEVFSVIEQMGNYHPAEPHWYLPFIGVDPARQGSGYGSALMEYALIPCDRENRLAYLESSNPRNIPLYRRHGFEVLGEIQVGSSPPVFPMLRKPQSI